MDSEQRDAASGEQAGDGRGHDAALTREQHHAERLVMVFFGITAAAGIGLFVLYFKGGQTQLEGVLWALALGGLGAGIGLWGLKLLAATDAVEERHVLASREGSQEAFEEALGEEVGPEMRRRSALLRMLIAAGGALGLALLLPLLSLGPAPGRSLKETGWRHGKRVVDENGLELTLDAVPIDGFLTIYPEGEVGRADSQALLIRVPAGLLQLPPAKMAGVPEGRYVAYSKLCTHAGCPVGLYRAQTRTLLCPCHQSQFDVLDGAKPFFGPASRPLPQLPLTVDPKGFLVALGDFDAPVGPAFWDRSRA